ncbi:hypothetical protein QBC40DRAFT_286113 [Triangularia verruculosa]|uniref:DUF7907 domain-containing protein n=1 Tax=Triangularia verruculosa TaxID=2587418 RepID=A0AAN6XCS3_9PEZI|nr:hypothetical protein QBC40DRAFT_286113 [Triangularia verruculosa]
MYSPLFVLAMAALATATTPTTIGTGFILVAHVTNPDQDFTPSVNNVAVNSIHASPGFRVATVSSSLTDGHVFYENGTLDQVADGETTVIFDSATPLTPFGILVQDPSAPIDNIAINAGPGSFNNLATDPEPRPVLVNGLGDGTYLVCNATVPYYRQNFMTLQYAYEGETVPENCVPVQLVPQCAVLNELPPGSHSSHEHALSVRCYSDATAVDWS